MNSTIRIIVGLVLSVIGIFIERTYPIGYKGFVFTIGCLGIALLIVGLAFVVNGLSNEDDEWVKEIW